MDIGNEAMEDPLLHKPFGRHVDLSDAQANEILRGHPRGATQHLLSMSNQKILMLANSLTLPGETQPRGIETHLTAHPLVIANTAN